MAVAIAGCRDQSHFSGPLILAGAVEVSPDILDEGRRKYAVYCARCHGEKGDGRGPASAGMWPPPRDFTQGVFKVAGDELPDDDDLIELLQRGIPGSRMPPFVIPERESRAVIHYLKTFSPRWQAESPHSTRAVSNRR